MFIAPIIVTRQNRAVSTLLWPLQYNCYCTTTVSKTSLFPNSNAAVLTKQLQICHTTSFTIFKSFLQWRLPTDLRTVLYVLRASRFSSSRLNIPDGLREPSTSSHLWCTCKDQHDGNVIWQRPSNRWTPSQYKTRVGSGV